MPPFRFVDHSDIDRDARKLIRSHVMIGKNLGKKKRTRRARDTSPAEDITTYTDAAVENPYDDNGIRISIMQISQRQRSLLGTARRVAGDPRLASFTASIAPQALFHIRQMTAGIIQAISPPEFCRHTGNVERAWFQLTFANEAHFHCIVALSSACAAFLMGDSSHSPVALYHMSRAYRLITQKLSSNEALADATISVVSSTTIYDRLYGDVERSMIHLNGVSEMINLKGGIRALVRRNFVIAEKAFRADLELALHFNSPPKFSSTDVPRHLIFIDVRDRPLPREPKNRQLAESVLYQSACADLREAILDILHFSHKLEDQAGQMEKLDPEEYHSTIIYVGYRLIEVKLCGEDYTADTSFNILVHLAMIGFQNTFCHCVGRQLVAFPLIAQRFRSTAQSIREDNPSRRMVVFWALLTGRVALLPDDADDHWFVPKLTAFANDLGLRTWADVSNALRPFPWVRAMHEVRGAVFWNKTMVPSMSSRPAAITS
ncbi:hypothetical protein F4861DRAFT_516509 [Xylaria intraflava]|nr:hypothetical protein F4861DRAFT_516509 [Xylaria intraflava]